ncbi:chromosomal replication initiator DnaA [Caulobacter sp. UC70_42]|uniref:DnaA regulatory inactivator HdaA n=1 Tax=Caulobacter sp. UC70_42 TaxID=3374551 RepID=UPI003756444A
MSTQFRLPLTAAPRYGREDFAVSGCNADAVARLDAWPNWPEGRLALVGPVGVGKTHLARTWARAADAVVVDAPRGGGVDLPALRGRAILVEDADQRSAGAALSDEDLFHILNMAGVDGGSVLLTARVAPIAWSSSVPDLRSRLNALTVAEIDEPDDVVLRAVLERAFRAEHLKPDPRPLSLSDRPPAPLGRRGPGRRQAAGRGGLAAAPRGQQGAGARGAGRSGGRGGLTPFPHRGGRVQGRCRHPVTPFLHHWAFTLRKTLR